MSLAAQVRGSARERVGRAGVKSSIRADGGGANVQKLRDNQTPVRTDRKCPAELVPSDEPKVAVARSKSRPEAEGQPTPAARDTRVE
ncbi:Hypothetical predicted protein [Olea europaea subsp. europaea]|uniref:Uncharacterized protein n=1 Tax=Olea europaea subsp. europaea TaxID=158383 RepID=A0A8S0TS99_OLEEU|nr:Hypothetical predicted protein [Olea europaea subsp. europaea]